MVTVSPISNQVIVLATLVNVDAFRNVDHQIEIRGYYFCVPVTTATNISPNSVCTMQLTVTNCWEFFALIYVRAFTPYQDKTYFATTLFS